MPYTPVRSGLPSGIRRAPAGVEAAGAGLALAATVPSTVTTTLRGAAPLTVSVYVVVADGVTCLLPRGVTAPIRSGAGYHLFQLAEQETLTEQMLAEGRQQARELLAQRKAQERFDEWLAGIRRRALIAIRL